MDGFDVVEDDPTESRFDREDEEDFFDLIDDIVSYCSLHNDKNVIIRTRLCGVNTATPDSIYYQKERLNYIIQSLESNVNFSRDIVLIGHSQGGIVSLESSINHNTTVKKVITISTPFGASEGAKLFMFIYYIGRIFSEEITNNIISHVYNVTDTTQLVQSINALSDNSYFNDETNMTGLIQRFNALSVKPQVYNLGGISGLADIFPFNSLFGGDYDDVNGFDGLVFGIEMVKLANTTKYFILPSDIPTLPCINNNPNQGNYLKGCKNCNNNCLLKQNYINLIQLIINSLDDLIADLDDFLNGITTFSNLSTTAQNLIDAISYGLAGEALPSSLSSYTSIYNIYKADNNHQNILTNLEILMFIKGVIG